jgi:hypothetical protein
MEAGTIEALDTSWKTRLWEQYIQENELIAARPGPLPSKPEPDSEVEVWSTPGEADTHA